MNYYSTPYTKVKTEEQKRKEKALKQAKEVAKTLREYEQKMETIRERLEPKTKDYIIKKVVNENKATLKANKQVYGKVIKFDLLKSICKESGFDTVPECLEDFFVKKGYVLTKKVMGVDEVYKGKENLKKGEDFYEPEN